MDIVVDASALLAVALNESERRWVITKTVGASPISPAVLPYEIGNALVAIVKRKRLGQDEAIAAYSITQSIPVRLVPVDVLESIHTAFQVGSYAYDAYYLRCALERNLPLLTLDNNMRKAARSLEIELLE